MKWLVALGLALATVVASAAPDKTPAGWPAKRKPATETHTPDAIRLFVDAIIADKAGDLGLALKHYESPTRRSSTPAPTTTSPTSTGGSRSTARRSRPTAST